MKKLQIFKDVDWFFLIFIIGVVNVKSYIKILFIFLYFISCWTRKWQFPGTLINPLKFYLIVPIIGLVAPILNGSFNQSGYWFGAGWGILQWLICAGALFLIHTTVLNLTKEKISDTISVFLAINFVVSILQLVQVMIIAHSVMPYWLGDIRYGVSTGDRLVGIFGSNSITNASICILGAVYFVFKRRPLLAAANLAIMLLCTSNLSLFVTLISLLGIVIFVKSKAPRKAAIGLIVFCVIFYPLLSPVNLKYISTIYKTFVLHAATKYENPDSTKVLGVVTSQQESDSADIHYPNRMYYRMSINKLDSANYISRLKELKTNNDKIKASNTNVAINQDLLKQTFAEIYGLPVNQAPLEIYSKPGKVHAYKQTFYFLKSSVKNLFFGAGIGNFSSKLAIKMTGLELQGKYPAKYVYASRPFAEYHLYGIFYYLSHDVAMHSVINMPNSVYDQMAGEYGIIGVLFFLIFYVFFFWKHRNKSGYSPFLIVVLILLFNVDYWFEMASFTVIFELLMLADITIFDKDGDTPAPNHSAHAGV